MINILDINDAQLFMATATELNRSYGVAFWDGRQYRFGNSAVSELRRKPLETKSDFWISLNTQPLSPPFGTARHSADLVYAHLKELLKAGDGCDDLVIVAPANVSDDQLSLLLGILQSLSIDISAVIDRSLIATHTGDQRSVHIETQWRQLLITEVIESNGDRSVTEAKPLPGLGLLDCYEQILERCADRCVDQTRFDPRRSADSEQELWNAVPDILAALQSSPKHTVSLGQYQFTVSLDDITPVGLRLMTEIDRVSSTKDRWFDEPLLAIPGVTTTREAVSGDVIAKTAEDIVQQLPDDQKGLVRIASLASSATSGTPAAEPSVVGELAIDPDHAETVATPTEAPLDSDIPTHLLIGHRAVSLASDEASSFGLAPLADGAVIAISMRDRITVLSLRGSYDRLFSGCRLFRDDGVEATLIHLEH